MVDNRKENKKYNERDGRNCETNCVRETLFIKFPFYDTTHNKKRESERAVISYKKVILHKKLQ